MSVRQREAYTRIMHSPRHLHSALIGAAAVLVVGSTFVPGHEQNGPIYNTVASVVTAKPATRAEPAGTDAVASKVASALKSLSSVVTRLSHPKALDDAFGAYFAYRAEHPTD